MIYFFKSPIGFIKLTEKNKKLIKLEIVDNSVIYPKTDFFEEWEKQIIEYFEKKRKTFEIPFELSGTNFQLKVWQELLKVEYGQTATYKEISNKLGTRAYQLVGKTIGQNPIPIIVPCHRILGVNSLGGFKYGLEKKLFLLEIEKS